VSGDVSVKLFRDEVFAARQTQWLGTIRIGRPPSFALVTGVALALAAALAAFAAWGEVTRKARLPGLLMPAAGVLDVTAPQAGVLLEVNVKEGDAVEAGQVLAVLSTDRTTARGELGTLIAHTLSQRRAALEAERQLAQRQARERNDALAQRLRSVEAERRHAEGELDAARRRMNLAEKSVERYRQLTQAGFVSDIQAQQKQEELLDLQAREQQVRRTLIALERDAQSLAADRLATATALQTQLAQLERSLASLDQEANENVARERAVITAPQAAIVSALTVHGGQTLQPGQTVATLVPHGAAASSELEAHLYAASRTAGFVQPGQKVWLRYAAYPYQKFGMAEGEIVSVSRTPISPNDLPSGQAQALLQAAQSSEPLYRISTRLQKQTISTYGQSQPLKPGMALEADVLQDRRAIWEWVLEPVLAASGRWTAPKPPAKEI
jgi:membrane fusion protein